MSLLLALVSGGPPVVAVSLAAIEGPDTASFNVGQSLDITLSVTEGADTAAITIGQSLNVSLAVTESPDTAAFTLSQTLAVTLAATEGQDTAALNITLLSADVPVALSATEGPDTALFNITNGTPEPVLSFSGGGGGWNRHEDKFFKELSRSIDDIVNPPVKQATPPVKKSVTPVNAKIAELFSSTENVIIPQNPSKPKAIIPSEDDDGIAIALLLLLA